LLSFYLSFFFVNAFFSHSRTEYARQMHTRGSVVGKARIIDPYEEQGPSSAIELSQSLDQSSGTLSPSSMEQPTTFKHSNVCSRRTSSAFLIDLINYTVTMLLF